LVATAGGIDSHIHFICPQQCEEALMSGVTTMMAAAPGRLRNQRHHLHAGPWNIGRMLQALEAFPLNFGLLGKATPVCRRR
jgi:urease subunit alpha